MRTLILSVATASLLGFGVAFTFQATRHVQPSSAASEEPMQATPAEPPVVAAATPITFRSVQSVAIVEPKAPSGASPQSEAEEHPAAASGVQASEGVGSAAPLVLPPAEQQTADTDAPGGMKTAATSQRVSSKRLQRRQHSAVLVTNSRSKRRFQAAKEEKAEPLPPPALAYDGNNEYHSPFHSLGKVFSGAQ
jgi:hypothetical protein